MSFGFGIGDFIALGTLAYRIYGRCKASSSEFQDLSREVNGLHIVVNAIEDYWTIERRHGRDLDNRQKLHLATLVGDCQTVLKNLDALLKKHHRLGVSDSFHARIKWVPKEIGPIREALLVRTTLLSSFNVTLTARSNLYTQAKILETLNNIHCSCESGSRPESAISAVTLEDINNEESNTWDAITAELTGEGLDSASVGSNRTFIRKASSGVLLDPIDENSESEKSLDGVDQHRNMEAEIDTRQRMTEEGFTAQDGVNAIRSDYESKGYSVEQELFEELTDEVASLTTRITSTISATSIESPNLILDDSSALQSSTTGVRPPINYYIGGSTKDKILGYFLLYISDPPTSSTERSVLENHFTTSFGYSWINNLSLTEATKFFVEHLHIPDLLEPNEVEVWSILKAKIRMSIEGFTITKTFFEAACQIFASTMDGFRSSQHMRYLVETLSNCTFQRVLNQADEDMDRQNSLSSFLPYGWIKAMDRYGWRKPFDSNNKNSAFFVNDIITDRELPPRLPTLTLQMNGILLTNYIALSLARTTHSFRWKILSGDSYTLSILRSVEYALKVVKNITNISKFLEIDQILAEAELVTSVPNRETYLQYSSSYSRVTHYASLLAHLTSSRDERSLEEDIFEHEHVWKFYGRFIMDDQRSPVDWALDDQRRVFCHLIIGLINHEVKLMKESENNKLPKAMAISEQKESLHSRAQNRLFDLRWLKAASASKIRSQVVTKWTIAYCSVKISEPLLSKIPAGEKMILRITEHTDLTTGIGGQHEFRGFSTRDDMFVPSVSTVHFAVHTKSWLRFELFSDVHEKGPIATRCILISSASLVTAHEPEAQVERPRSRYYDQERDLTINLLSDGRESVQVFITRRADSRTYKVEPYDCCILGVLESIDVKKPSLTWSKKRDSHDFYYFGNRLGSEKTVLQPLPVDICPNPERSCHSYKLPSELSRLVRDPHRGLPPQKIFTPPGMNPVPEQCLDPLWFVGHYNGTDTAVRSAWDGTPLGSSSQ